MGGRCLGKTGSDTVQRSSWDGIATGWNARSDSEPCVCAGRVKSPKRAVKDSIKEENIVQEKESMQQKQEEVFAQIVFTQKI